MYRGTKKTAIIGAILCALTAQNTWSMPASFWPAFLQERWAPLRNELRSQLSEAGRKEISAATVRLVADDGSYCSATVLSPDGYVLTALHCVERCLLEHRLLERFSNRYIETLSFRTLRQPAPDTVCKGFSVPDADRDRVELVHIGPGVVNFVDYHPIHRIASSEFSRLTQLRGDFAILKASSQKTEISASLPCAQIDAAPQSTLPGSALFALGFPLPKRSTKLLTGRAPATGGKTPHPLQLLEGRVTQSLGENPVIRDSHFSQSVFRRVEEFHRGPGVRLAHLDIYPGMSGGPVVSDAGKLVGTVSGVVDESQIDLEFVPNNGVYTPLSFVYASMQKSEGPVAAAKIFSCKVN